MVTCDIIDLLTLAVCLCRLVRERLKVEVEKMSNQFSGFRPGLVVLQVSLLVSEDQVSEVQVSEVQVSEDQLSEVKVSP